MTLLCLVVTQSLHKNHAKFISLFVGHKLCSVWAFVESRRISTQFCEFIDMSGSVMKIKRERAPLGDVRQGKSQFSAVESILDREN